MGLFQTCKDTKFESNSQPTSNHCVEGVYCFRRAKIQNLRAIHNVVLILAYYWRLFQTCKDTKFESNSQPGGITLSFNQTCKDTKFESNSQVIRIFITTNYYCFRRAKIQNLRAIHNYVANGNVYETIVSDVQRYKIWEQFTTKFVCPNLQPLLFQTCKDTKFESNSQLLPSVVAPMRNCFRRAKIQNLRAIHNIFDKRVRLVEIVSDVQRYKIWEQFTTT